MKCLHISNDFSLTPVHSNLYRTLDRMAVQQIVFNPVREETPVGRNKVDFKTDGSVILYSRKIHKLHRYLFRRKIAHLYNDLRSKVDLKDLDIVHATTLFSDGAIALKIKKQFGIPYVVAVRATDIEIFLKYRKDLIFRVRSILKEASSIVFISDSLKKRFSNHQNIKGLWPLIEPKCKVIYNGIDDFWLDSISPQRKIDPFNILYVGRLIGRKNIISLVEAVFTVRSKGIPCVANFVGSGGSDEEKIRQLSLEHKGIINFLGPVHDKMALRDIYRDSHIFAMPSYGETFGLVYIEALSQGLPLLYCQDEGIDGVFSQKVGERCKDASDIEIASSLEKIIMNYNTYELDKIDFSIFRWENIAKVYYNLYTSVIHP